MQVEVLTLHDMIDKCHNLELVQNYKELSIHYKIIYEKHKKIKQSKSKNLDVQNIQKELYKSLNLIKKDIILNNSNINRFYDTEEFLSFCKNINFIVLGHLEKHILISFIQDVIPSLLVCSQTEIMQKKNTYLVHGWSEDGKKLYRYSDKFENY